MMLPLALMSVCLLDIGGGCIALVAVYTHRVTGSIPQGGTLALNFEMSRFGNWVLVPWVIANS